jgi:putative hydrolase of the HAD superfamily
VAVRGAIFDLGHTLMRLDGTWPEVFEQGVADLAAYLEVQGLAIDGVAFGSALLERRAEVYARAKETRREVTAEASMRWTLAQWGLADPDPALIRGAIDAFFAYEDRCWLAFPEAVAVLRELAGRGLRLGMFSNATDDLFIQRLVDRLGFRPWLDPALSSAGTGIRKPDPAAFAPILEAWDLPPASVVMVGDTLEADILGAQLAGMRGVWIPAREDARQQAEDARQEAEDARQEGGSGRPAAPPPATIVPDAILDRLGELPALIQSSGW